MAAQIKIEDQKEIEKENSGPPKSKKKDAGKKGQKKSDLLLKELKAKLEAKEQESNEAYDRFLRVSAEFENFKKRSFREMSDFKKFANESLLKEMLPIVDNLELALSSLNEKGNPESGLREGVELTLKEILKTLEKFGVKPIEALEKVFDPNFHQAVMQEESEDYPEQTVLKELQKGYLIHDRLLRPAMVVVSK
jgi:molecular chaperone GrpE